MLQLIIKDFRANGVYQLLSLLIIFSISTLFIFLMLEANGSIDPEVVIYIMVVMLSSSVVSLLFMIVDEISKSDEIFISLPVTRNQVVFAKYITSIVQMLLAMLFHFLGAQLGIYIQGGSDFSELEIIYNPMLWLWLLLVLIIFKTYAYPLYFKFGLSIGIGIHTVIQISLIITLILSFQVLNPAIHIQRVWEWVANQNTYMILASIISLFLLALSGSMVLSARLYKNKNI